MRIVGAKQVLLCPFSHSFFNPHCVDLIVGMLRHLIIIYK